MSDFFAIPDATKEMLEAVLFAAGRVLFALRK